MRFIAAIASCLAISSAAAATKEASLQPFTTSSEGELELNPTIYTTENFTASDGETYEITYLSGAPGIESRSAFHRRQQDSDDPLDRWTPNRFPKNCPFGSIQGDTGPNAPTTGRCMAIRDWCASNPGVWAVFPGDGFDGRGGYYPLVSSGKAGTTACHFAVVARGALEAIGSYDVRDWARAALDRYTRGFDGVYRVRARGKVTRETGRQCQNGVRPQGVHWKLDTLQGIQLDDWRQ